MSISVDTSEVRAFQAELGKATLKANEEIIQTMRKAAVNIKTAVQRDLRASGDAGFRYVARSVDFDEFDRGLTIELGPSKPAGALANVAFFGTSRGGGTVRDPVEALRDETPTLIQELDRIVGGLLD